MMPKSAAISRDSAGSVRSIGRCFLHVGCWLFAIAVFHWPAQAQNLHWAKSAGGSGSDQPSGIAVDSLGNSYVTGVYGGSATFGAGLPNQTVLTSTSGTATDIVFVAKYDVNGAFVWAKKSGGTNGNGITVDSAGNSYVTGRFATGNATFGEGEANETVLLNNGGHLFLAKFDANGLLQWARPAGSFAAASDAGQAVAVDGSGNVYWTGYIAGNATFGAGQPNQVVLSATGDDTFLAKYDSAGMLQWAKRAGGSSGDQGFAIALDGAGNSYLTGRFGSFMATFGAGEANQTVLQTAGGLDIFVAKYNSSGLLQWVKRAGGTSHESGRSVGVDAFGNIYVTGEFAGTATFGPGEANQTVLTASGSEEVFVAKYNPSGLLQWAKQASGTGTRRGTGIAVDAFGNSYVTGRFTVSATFNASEPSQTTLTAPMGSGSQMYVAKYDASGALVWARRAGTTGTQATIGNAIAIDGARNSYVAGDFRTSATFGPGEANQTVLTSASAGIADVFVAKFADASPIGPIAVNCSADSLQTAINLAAAGSTILVSGTCSENILIRNEKQRVTVDGGGTATINAPSNASPALNVRGKGILIHGFTITGGSHAVYVNRGSNAVLNNNTIQNSSGNGVLIDELAFAVLTNNSIQNNPGAGVFVSENSTARIGFNSDSETVASTNTISSNGVGVLISNSSSARVIGNTIQNNTGAGVQVLRDSHADIASNAINGNADGIEVSENSVVQLGEDTGSSIFESPNTTTSTNTAFGIRCTDGGAADGRLGSLMGASGPMSFNGTCANSLVP